MNRNPISQRRELQLKLRWPRQQLGEPRKIVQINSGTSGVSWKLETTQGEYFVKLSSASTHRLVVIHRLVSHLKDRGAEVIAPLRLGTRPYLAIGRNRYQIFPYVTSGSKGPERLWAQKVGEALAHIHMMLKEAHDYSDIRELNLVPTSSTVLRSRLDEIMRLVRSRLPLFIEDSQAEQLGERLIGLVSSWHGRLSSFQEIVAPRLNLQIIHGDFQPENVLPVPGRRCVVIDFEKVGYGPPAYDVAKFIACSFFSDNQPRFSHFKATEFLCGYERVRSLSSIERESLHYLVLICQLSGLWALEEYYTRQNPGARRFITSYLNRLEWLEKHLGDLLNPRQRESSMYRGKQLELVQNPNGEIPDHQ